MLLEQFTTVLDQYHQPGHRIVLALSGGVDSRVLLHLLSAYRQQHPQNQYLAVHIHHGLSQNADLWAEKCQLWCDMSSIPLVIEKVNLTIDVQTSIEQEAREQRYIALAKHISPGDTLITGQHLGDQTETFLLALKRGSGPKGLSSMPVEMPFSKGKIVRPLLSVSRKQIQDFASDNQLNWVEDESNTDTRFDRNFLRAEIIPQLKSRWPHIESTISRSASLCAEQEQLLEELLSEKLQSMLTSDGGLSVSLLGQQSTLARNQLLRLWLANNGFLMPSQKQLLLIWNDVAQSRKDANPKLVLTSGEVRRYQNKIYLTQKYADVTDWRADIKLNERVILPDNLGQIELIKGTESANLRAFKSDETLWITFNPESLTAHPVERGHSRNLKKLFQEYGVPSWLRRRIPILMANNQVVSVQGLFVDKAFSGCDCELVWKKSKADIAKL